MIQAVSPLSVGGLSRVQFEGEAPPVSVDGPLFSEVIQSVLQAVPSIMPEADLRLTPLAARVDGENQEEFVSEPETRLNQPGESKTEETATVQPASVQDAPVQQAPVQQEPVQQEPVQQAPVLADQGLGELELHVLQANIVAPQSAVVSPPEPHAGRESSFVADFSPVIKPVQVEIGLDSSERNATVVKAAAVDAVVTQAIVIEPAVSEAAIVALPIVEPTLTAPPVVEALAINPKVYTDFKYHVSVNNVFGAQQRTVPLSVSTAFTVAQSSVLPDTTASVARLDPVAQLPPVPRPTVASKTVQEPMIRARVLSTPVVRLPSVVFPVMNSLAANASASSVQPFFSTPLSAPESASGAMRLLLQAQPVQAVTVSAGEALEWMKQSEAFTKQLRMSGVINEAVAEPEVDLASSIPKSTTGNVGSTTANEVLLPVQESSSSVNGSVSLQPLVPAAVAVHQTGAVQHSPVFMGPNQQHSVDAVKVALKNMAMRLPGQFEVSMNLSDGRQVNLNVMANTRVMELDVRVSAAAQVKEPWVDQLPGLQKVVEQLGFQLTTLRVNGETVMQPINQLQNQTQQQTQVQIQQGELDNGSSAQSHHQGGRHEQQQDSRPRQFIEPGSEAVEPAVDGTHQSPVVGLDGARAVSVYV